MRGQEVVTWVVGRPMVVGDRLFDDDTGTEVTTGTVTNTFWRGNGGAVEFLQADGVTWGPTQYDWPCPYVAGTGFVNLTTNAPSSAVEQVVHYAVTHDVYGLVASGENLVIAASQSVLGLSLA